MKTTSMRIFILQTLSAITLCTTIVACSSDHPDPGPNDDSVSRSIDITEAEKEVSIQSNKFAWRLLEECSATTDDNLALSPLSANLCLSMLANGAAGESRRQILDALGFEDQDMASVNSLNQKLTHKLRNLDHNVILNLANSLWYDKERIKLKKDFLDDLWHNYEIESHEIDHFSFARDVNKWCSGLTYGLIPRILDDDADNDFAFVNAMYFKGRWNSDYKFDKNATHKRDFHNADGSVAFIDFMSHEQMYEFCMDETWSAIRIPFGGGGYRLTIILPDENHTIDYCMGSIIANEPATSQFQIADIHVLLPKFKMLKEIDLIEVLMKLGIEDIFDIFKADLSNMMELSYDEVAYINLVKQSVGFEVNEDGAEAAAVTIVGGDLLATAPLYMPFVIDRPFIYMISERSTGAILFLGRINNLYNSKCVNRQTDS